MPENNSIEEIFLKALTQFTYKEEDLDYSVLDKHIKVLETLANIGNSGTGIFDFSKRQIIYYSPNFGSLLGYRSSDYQELGQYFFAAKIHPEDALRLSKVGLAILKIMNNLSEYEKLDYKHVFEYRMLNAENNYVRLVEQYQVLELDPHGQLWLMLTIVDLSPNQDVSEPSKSQLMNFKTGKMIPIEPTHDLQLELTKRELEILRLVKSGLLSKEISDKLSISVHTVNTHRQRVLEKLQANNSIEAVKFAASLGLLD